MLKKSVLTLVAGAVLSSTVQAADVTIGIRSEPSSIDPSFHNLGPNNAMLGHVFGRLIEWTPNQKMIPRLAESWKAVNDTTWEFKLRQGVKFHDGSDFTADDVIYSSSVRTATPAVTPASAPTPRARRSRRSTTTPSTS